MHISYVDECAPLLFQAVRGKEQRTSFVSVLVTD